MQGLSSDFEQFFLVKNNFVCVFLRKKYGFEIGNATEKNKLYFDQEEIGNAMEKINSVLILNREKLSLHLSLSTPYAGD